MKTLSLYYATNRKHEGSDRWHPTSYGKNFSDDGAENLRFGWLNLSADEKVIDKHHKRKGAYGVGDGVSLATYLTEQARGAKIEAYKEKLDPNVADIHQENAKLGSLAMFDDLKKEMMDKTDVLIYIHGFNVSWHEAVGSALALQEMLNNSPTKDPDQNLLVILFTWPSDGMALPFVSYKSDRTEAQASGYAFGRGMLKVRDFLMTLKKDGGGLCGQDIHLLCHSMGNYVLQNTIERIYDHTSGSALPRVFEHIFMCAPDVDDNALETDKEMGRVHELARFVNVYHNEGDKAMYVSDYTKGNPERLGTKGAARPMQMHNKVNQIDCSPVVKGQGLVEHSYYLMGKVNEDIRQSIDGMPHDSGARRRNLSPKGPNVWVMK
ncbi:MAG: alpha/beta hydrolase [Deltaproteobacteria bacterium]|nr:alpha/beta hydrolase [Deltaproteobacteria bacterium]